MANYQILSGSYKMPSVGLGTWNATEDAELISALNRALQCGYRHIDTAYLYKNEHIIGNVLQRWFISGQLKREDIFITTKLPPEGIHPDRVEKYLKKSLEALQLDYVDLYLIHFPVGVEETAEGAPKIPIDTDHIAIWQQMEKQVDTGRVKLIGLSNFTTKQIEKIWQNSRIKPACHQIELHPYLQHPRHVKFCQDKNIVVVGYSSLGSGINTLLSRMGKPSVTTPNILSDETIKRIASKHEKSTAQVILRFFIQKNIVVIPKSVNPERIRENFDLFDFTLSNEDLKSIENLDKGESGRILDLVGKTNQRIAAHPEYPYGKDEYYY